MSLSVSDVWVSVLVISSFILMVSCDFYLVWLPCLVISDLFQLCCLLFPLPSLSGVYLFSESPLVLCHILTQRRVLLCSVAFPRLLVLYSWLQPCPIFVFWKVFSIRTAFFSTFCLLSRAFWVRILPATPCFKTVLKLINGKLGITKGKSRTLRKSWVKISAELHKQQTEACVRASGATSLSPYWYQTTSE